MRTVDSTRARWIVASLAVLMTATRFHHEGTPFALPDASLAVFFLAGWYVGSLPVLAGLLAGAFAIDYIAIVHGGVSDYCVSPAYGFLVPTYAAMWWAGRWAGCAKPLEASSRLRIGAALPISVTLAFVISSGSFFLFSGRLDGADWMEYSLGVARDYPGYLVAAVIYCGLAFGVDALIRFSPSLERWQIKFKFRT
jgi:hypothetical protein